MNNIIIHYRMVTLKYLILGDSGSGKTSIRNQYITKTFENNTNSTIGLDFHIKNENINGQEFKIHFWDMAGQERFRAIVRSYYRNCHAAIIVFDLSNRETFESLDFWYEEIKKIYQILDDKSILKPTIYLIGNKTDINTRSVTDDEIQKFLHEKHILKYMECSAKDNYNISYIFQSLNNDVYQNLVLHNLANPIQNKRTSTIDINYLQKKHKRCCYIS